MKYLILLLVFPLSGCYLSNTDIEKAIDICRIYTNIEYIHVDSVFGSSVKCKSGEFISLTTHKLKKD